MVHRGKRSPKSTLKRHIWQTSYQDDTTKEIICKIDPQQAITYLITLTDVYGNKIYPVLDMSLPTSIIQGEVIQDPRGLGSSQQQIGIFQR
jgi:hypothetical protein